MRRFGTAHGRTDLRGLRRLKTRQKGATGCAGRRVCPWSRAATPGTGSARGWRLAVVVEMRGQRLDDTSRQLAQTWRPATAVTEHLPVKEYQQQRVGQHANHRQHHERLVVLLMHGRVLELALSG